MLGDFSGVGPGSRRIMPYLTAAAALGQRRAFHLGCSCPAHFFSFRRGRSHGRLKNFDMELSAHN
jgi:hypothetical protein